MTKLDIFAKSFMNATRNQVPPHTGARAHWRQSERFDNRESAEIEAHLVGRRT